MAQPADIYPSRPIRLVVGFAAGSNADTVARPLGQRLAQTLGQQVIIDNRPGASGMIGIGLVAAAAPDGYTLLSAPHSSVVISPHLQGAAQLDVIGALAPVTPFARFPLVLVTHPALPAKTVRELIDLAKRKPGSLSFASSGSGSGLRMAGELFKSLAQVELLHVPYKDASPLLSDVINGRVDMVFNTFAVVAPHLKQGKLRALAVTGTARAAASPELPTLDEAGVPGYEYMSWHGIFAPARTPPHLIDALNRAVATVLESQAMKDLYNAQNVETVTSTPQAFAAQVRADYAKWGRVIRAAGIKPE